MWLIIKRQITRNNQQQKEATVIGQRKGKVEEKKYSDCEKQNERNKTYTFWSTSTRAKIGTKKREKEGNIHPELSQDKNCDTLKLRVEMYVHDAMELLKQK